MGGKDDGRGGRRRKRRRGNASSQRDEPGRSSSRENTSAVSRNKNRSGGGFCVSDGRTDGAGKSGIPRLRWVPPKLNTDPLPEPECVYCGRPIQDISAAIEDKSSGRPAHFDCVIARLSGSEPLEAGDVISYIGGGRFGVVHFNERSGESRAASRGRQFHADETPGRVFIIKKIFEWENGEERPVWRTFVADHYSIT
jgi:hypothetical protein